MDLKRSGCQPTVLKVPIPCDPAGKGSALGMKPWRPVRFSCGGPRDWLPARQRGGGESAFPEELLAVGFHESLFGLQSGKGKGGAPQREATGTSISPWLCQGPKRKKFLPWSQARCRGSIRLREESTVQGPGFESRCPHLQVESPELLTEVPVFGFILLFMNRGAPGSPQNAAVGALKAKSLN